MRYLFLDTNIYLSCALIREPGADSDLLSKLNELLASGGATLIVPEVVELELERQQGRLREQLQTRIAAAKAQVEKLEILPYVHGELPSVVRALDEIVTRRESNFARVQDLLPTLDDSVLLFCSDNIGDFALFDKHAERHQLRPEGPAGSATTASCGRPAQFDNTLCEQGSGHRDTGRRGAEAQGVEVTVDAAGGFVSISSRSPRPGVTPQPWSSPDGFTGGVRIDRLSVGDEVALVASVLSVGTTPAETLQADWIHILVKCQNCDGVVELH